MALLQSDERTVFRIEAEISGLEQFFKVVDSKFKTLDKLGEVSPTDFKY